MNCGAVRTQHPTALKWGEINIIKLRGQCSIGMKWRAADFVNRRVLSPDNTNDTNNRWKRFILYIHCGAVGTQHPTAPKVFLLQYIVKYDNMTYFYLLLFSYAILSY